MRVDCLDRFWLCVICTSLILAAGCAGQANSLSQTANLPDCARTDLVVLSEKIVEDSKDGLEKLSKTPDVVLKSTKDNIVNLTDKIIENSKDSLEHLSETSDFVLETAKANARDWKTTVIGGTKDTFSKKDNIIALLLAGGASVALHSSDADKRIAESIEDKQVFHDFTDESLNVIGHPWAHIGASALWYMFSSDREDELNKQRAKTMVSALSVTGAVTMGLKAIRHNEAPNGKNWAWPSGHTASCFTAASVLDEFYGPKVGIPAYALASVVAYRMMDSGDHWTSDVVFGATLGWVVGHTFAGKHKGLEMAGFKVVPAVANSHGPVMGICLAKRF
ncbi:MAG: phosphatase PAP2 family protein [Planctomycetota bacterium]|nr:MAG: phosphatase PAP2 family protein [Planctomycetota bacterium]